MLLETILDLGKCPNQKTQESESAGFLVWALPEVQNCCQKQFSDKVIYNNYLKKKLERLDLKNGASKNGFPIVF